MRKIKTLKRIIREGGISCAVKVALDKAQKIFPHYSYYEDNQVKTRKKYLFDRYVSSSSDNEAKEGGIVKCHEKLSKEGDKVLVVGGGSGVTGVRAAWIVGNKGKVIIYEGGKESVREIKSNILKNGVSRTCEVRHSVVGPEKNVYGGETRNASSVSPNGLPECDVLELDCEGSEIKIMKEMKISPRVIISEMHPWNTKYNVEKYTKIFDNIGYELRNAYGHDGVSVSRGELETLLYRSKEEGKRYVGSGARWPVVMAGVKVD